MRLDRAWSRMTRLVSILNSVVTGLFDLLFRPLSGLPPAWAIVLFSVPAGILMLLVFKSTSPQEAIRKARDRVVGNLLAVRLFGSEMAVVLRIQAKLLRSILVYLALSLPPMLVLLPPAVLATIQLHERFSVRPLRPGETAVVNLSLQEAAAMEGEIRLEVPNGIRLETEAVRIPSRREISWRIRGESEGRYRIAVTAAGETVEKRVRVGSGWGKTSARRPSGGFWDALLHPGEPPLPFGSRIESVEVLYPSLEMELLGMEVSWLAVFLVVSIGTGFALKGVFGVEV